MKDIIRYIKTTGTYLIGNVLTKIISFFLLPVYTKYLPPADYGTYDLNIAYITFLSSILFLDIWGGIMRFMFDYKEAEGKADAVKAGMVIFSVSTGIYTVAVIILGNILGIEYKFWLFMYGLLTNMQQVLGFVARGYGKNKVFAFGGVVASLITIICNIGFIVGLRGGYQYLYISSCIGLSCNILILARAVSFLGILSEKRLDCKLLKAMTFYSLPLSVNSAAFWFLSSFNKVLISNRLSTAENGMYAVANKFSSIIALFTQCFQMAWQELTFSKADKNKNEMEIFYTGAFNEYVKFMTLGCMFVIAGVKITFPFLVNKAYADSENIVPVAILAALFSCFASFLGSILSTLKKNRYIFTTTLAGSVVNVIIAVTCMNYIGVHAANIALMFGYMVICIRRFQLINRHIRIRIKWSSILFLIIETFLVCLVYLGLPVIFNGILIVLLCCESVFLYKDKIEKFYIRERR